jgi:hypothetical protein
VDGEVVGEQAGGAEMAAVRAEQAQGETVQEARREEVVAQARVSASGTGRSPAHTGAGTG